MTISRRRLLEAGAVGTLAVGLASDRAQGNEGAGGVHVHATLDQVEPPLNLKLIVDTTVWGPDGYLTGMGYDALPDPNDPGSPNVVQVGPCIWTHQGTVDGDEVRLVGRVMYAHAPVDHSAEVTTEANLATGRIRFTFDQLAGATLVFTGTGVVTRI